jgi:hypothetical protein
VKAPLSQVLTLTEGDRIAMDALNVSLANGGTAFDLTKLGAENLKPALDEAGQGMNELLGIIHDLGIKTQHDLDAAAEKAKTAFEGMRVAGVFSAEDRAKAELKYLEALKAAGTASEEQIRQFEALQRVMGGVGDVAVKTTQKQRDALSKLRQQVSTIFTDMSRGIAEVIVKGESLGKVFQKVGQEIAIAIVRLAIEGGTDKLIKELDLINVKFLGLGKVFKSIFGGGSKSEASIATPPFVPGKIPGIDSPNAAGAAAGASSLTSIVGAVASVGTLISSIIGNFQNARQETTLNAIELNTRRGTLFLGDRGDGGILGQLFKLNDELAFGFSAKSLVNDIAPTLRGIRDALGGGISARSGGGVTINGPVTIEISGSGSPRETAQAFMDTLRSYSPKFQPA